MTKVFPRLACLPLVLVFGACGARTQPQDDRPSPWSIPQAAVPPDTGKELGRPSALAGSTAAPAAGASGQLDSTQTVEHGPGMGRPDMGDGEAGNGSVSAEASSKEDDTNASQPNAAERSPSASANRAAEAWVGEIWTIGPFLCDPNEDSTTDEIDHTAPRTTRVVLILEPSSDPSMPAGRIRFAEGELPTTAALDWRDRLNDDFWYCSNASPALGGEYSLFHVRRTADSLTFAIAPGEIWRNFCDQHWPANDCGTDRCFILSDCSCDAEGCYRNAQWFTLELVQHGDSFEGSFPLGLGEIRFQRVQ